MFRPLTTLSRRFGIANQSGPGRYARYAEKNIEEGVTSGGRAGKVWWLSEAVGFTDPAIAISNVLLHGSLQLGQLLF